MVPGRMVTARSQHPVRSKLVGIRVRKLAIMARMALPVVYHPEYEAEWRDLPPAERAALATAVEKLRADNQLGFPHTSLVRGSNLGVRELRPRRGRSRWRALYRGPGTCWSC
jgi:mRNA-degrading endonuclease RelE of RelBE toxin-antitoxin system